MTEQRVVSEYVGAGVNNALLDVFGRIMGAAAKRTLHFPRRRGVEVTQHDHGGGFRYLRSSEHAWRITQEGLGNKNWIAEWMYRVLGNRTYYDVMAREVALMAANDVAASGALPVVATDEVSVGNGDWYQDERRAQDFADGWFAICERLGMALAGGETASLKYLVKPELPVESAPVLSAAVVGVIAPLYRAIGSINTVLPGMKIIGVPSISAHCNGFSLIIKRGLQLQEQFLTKLPDGRTYGEHALLPTQEYVTMMSALQDRGVPIVAALPGTGGGVAKLASGKVPLTFAITAWPEFEKTPPLFQCLRELGVSWRDLVTTFNMGMGYYLFVTAENEERTIQTVREAGYEGVMSVGDVREGAHGVLWQPLGYPMDFLEPPKA